MPDGYIVPEHAKDWNDVISWGCTIKYISRLIRDNFQRRKSSLFTKGVCVHCGSTSNIQLHHIVPVWAFCLKHILSNDPQGFRDLTEIANIPVDYSFVNGSDNIIELCKGCHNKEEKITYKKWKTYFLSNYKNIAWGIRDVRKVERILNQNDKKC